MKILINYGDNLCLCEAGAIMCAYNSNLGKKCVQICNFYHNSTFYCTDDNLINNFNTIIKNKCNLDIIDLSQYKFMR